MLNGKKFRDEIANLCYKTGKDISYIVNTEYLGYSHSSLSYFDNGYITGRAIDWLLSEYKEPIKLSRLEFEILKYAKKQGFNYIARNRQKGLCSCECKPRKCVSDGYWDCSEIGFANTLYSFDELFQFIKWEDNEPTNIQDVLGNCEIIKEEE